MPGQSIPPILAEGFYFLRHGQSTANAHGVIGGSMDVALTDLGHAQAEAAAKTLGRFPIKTILCSPQSRARDTAHPLAEKLGMAPLYVDDLRERGWGVLEGRPLSERISLDDHPEGGEAKDAFFDRVWNALFALDPDRLPGPRLIVAHTGVNRALRVRLGIGDEPKRIANGKPVHFLPGTGPDAPGWRVKAVDH